MPYVHVQITRDGVTKAQKAQLVAEFTETLVRVLKKRPEHTHIVIDEIETDNWGFAGVLTTEYRAAAAKGAKSAPPPKPARPRAARAAERPKR